MKDLSKEWHRLWWFDCAGAARSHDRENDDEVSSARPCKRSPNHTTNPTPKNGTYGRYPAWQQTVHNAGCVRGETDASVRLPVVLDGC